MNEKTVTLSAAKLSLEHALAAVDHRADGRVGEGPPPGPARLGQGQPHGGRHRDVGCAGAQDREQQAGAGIEADQAAAERDLARITLEEFARIRNARLKFKSVPVFYLPYMVWPATTDRASGHKTEGSLRQWVRSASHPICP